MVHKTLISRFKKRTHTHACIVPPPLPHRAARCPSSCCIAFSLRSSHPLLVASGGTAAPANLFAIAFGISDPLFEYSIVCRPVGPVRRLDQRASSELPPHPSSSKPQTRPAQSAVGVQRSFGRRENIYSSFNLGRFGNAADVSAIPVLRRLGQVHHA